VITAVDSNVLIDVFWGDPEFGPLSFAALEACTAQGGLVACEVVWAEVAAGFERPAAAEEAMGRAGVRFVPLDAAMALVAGEAWRGYRRRARRRDRLLADFLVGAHAARSADRLLTRDRGFYARYVKDLEVLDPTRAR
jgi:predicted nucleic acid-binding protein